MNLGSTFSLLMIAAACACLPACTKATDEKTAAAATAAFIAKHDYKGAVISAGKSW